MRKYAFDRLLEGNMFIRGIAPITVMAFTLVLKLGMYIYAVKVGKKVQNRLEKLGEIDRAFVHIDPVS